MHQFPVLKPHISTTQIPFLVRGATPSSDWAGDRERAVLDTIYYCEICNAVMERGDPDVARHKQEMPNHKMRRVMILRCGHCGNVVTDSHAEYSPEKNQFWCKNCIGTMGAHSFHSA